MRLSAGKITYSPSDLITYLDSPFASAMDRRALDDKDVRALRDPDEGMMLHLAEKGTIHEEEFEDELKQKHPDLCQIADLPSNEKYDATIRAMKDGVSVITQAYLKCGDFAGYADFLYRIEGKSKLGNYHYTVWDTKLSRRMKPAYAIQLCCYAEMLETIQGRLPEYVSIVLGNKEEETLRVASSFAYYKSLKRSFLEFHADGSPARETLPDPALSASFGNWSNLANEELEKRDHLSKVANLRRSQILTLEKAGITTMSELANTKLETISKMGSDTFARARRQARLQLVSEGQEIPIFEVQNHDDDVPSGLSLLPPASANDVFFDIEGLPTSEGSLEYLWGNTYLAPDGTRLFKDFWAHDSDQEKQAFIEFIDWVYDRWTKDPAMHVYHYAPYEMTAIRRLMGQYGVCEHKVDNLLRFNVFVDLYKIVRHGIMIGEPRYSIKNVEHIYRGKRDTDVANGADSIIVYEQWKENPDGDTWETSPTLKSIRDYNVDDCDSTLELAIWLRTQQVEHGIKFQDYEVPEALLKEEIETSATLLRDKLLSASSGSSDSNTSELLELLAWSLEFHKRENKPVWWKLFDRKGWSEVELYDDMECLADVQRTSTPTIDGPRNTKLHEYQFDVNQPYKGNGKTFHVLDQENLKVNVKDFDPETGVLLFSNKNELPPRLNLIPDQFVNPRPIPNAIETAVEHALETDFAPSAIIDFLQRNRPRIKNNTEGDIINSETDFIENVTTTVHNLQSSYLCIQGPPGAGKTYTAKHIIGSLLAAGKRVGISSNSHKAINNLLGGVAEHVETRKIASNLFKIQSQAPDDEMFEKHSVKHEKSASKFSCEEDAICVGGTAWAFCNENMADQFDYLFIDEAGQVSIANLIGMSAATQNIILMGDQMQLPQPIQGTHPGESGASILDYLLQHHATIPSDLGVFLPMTYRMHPDVCSPISSQVYDGRLQSAPSASKHIINAKGPIIDCQSGVKFIPVEHEGNTQGSQEEVDKIIEITKELLGTNYWAKSNGKSRKITLNDILFVAPYNFQVNNLQAALGDNARVGTIDKFQGQEAPIVILSMCASDPSEAARGIDFLYSKNRLNVAISRAQAIAIIVANPALAHTKANSISQIEQINFFCELVECSK